MAWVFHFRTVYSSSITRHQRLSSAGVTHGDAVLPPRLNGKPRRGRRGSSVTRAFTLLEILLSIAIIALLATVLIGGSAHLLSEQPVTASEVFWKAVQEARKAALKAEHDIRLKFDKEKKQFVLIDGIVPASLSADGFSREERPLKQFPIPARSAADLTVEFLGPATKGGGNTILVGGVLLDSQPLSYVTFYSDGTCMTFRAQFARGGGASTLTIDPWTCAPVLPPLDPNASPLP
jgi:prepilin-type N-terminal cleavage/methylation domain-containing protein